MRASQPEMPSTCTTGFSTTCATTKWKRHCTNPCFTSSFVTNVRMENLLSEQLFLNISVVKSMVFFRGGSRRPSDETVDLTNTFAYLQCLCFFYCLRLSCNNGVDITVLRCEIPICFGVALHLLYIQADRSFISSAIEQWISIRPMF